MKSFLQFFIVLSLFSSLTYANEFKDVRFITLKKDEQKKILVKYGSVEKLFKFRWTLYKNGGLVLFRSYDRIVAQNILYLRGKNQNFRLELMPKGKGFNIPSLLVKFKEFNFETNEASFELFLSDKNDKVTLKEL